MNFKKSCALAIAVSFLALLGPACTHSLAMITPEQAKHVCDPDWERDDTCSACGRAACCEELKACGLDPEGTCGCNMACKVGGAAFCKPPCGPKNDAYIAIARCTFAHCAHLCPHLKGSPP